MKFLFLVDGFRFYNVGHLNIDYRDLHEGDEMFFSIFRSLAFREIKGFQTNVRNEDTELFSGCRLTNICCSQRILVAKKVVEVRP